MLRLAKHLAKEFKEKSKVDVFKHPKGILKLYKEAERVKNVLSANADHVAQVEGLVDEVDFKSSKITRVEFERICADLFDRLERPLEDALKSAEVTFVIPLFKIFLLSNKWFINCSISLTGRYKCYYSSRWQYSYPESPRRTSPNIQKVL